MSCSVLYCTVWFCTVLYCLAWLRIVTPCREQRASNRCPAGARCFNCCGVAASRARAASANNFKLRVTWSKVSALSSRAADVADSCCGRLQSQSRPAWHPYALYTVMLLVPLLRGTKVLKYSTVGLVMYCIVWFMVCLHPNAKRTEHTPPHQRPWRH